MKLILQMAFRNLFRHKSRSILIGLGIFASVVFLTMGYSLSKGMFKVLVNNYIDSGIAGHCNVRIFEKYDSKTRTIIRYRDAIVSKIMDSFRDVKEVRETLMVSVYATVNGKGSGLGLTGIRATSKNDIRNMEIVEGDFEKFFNTGIENPLILEYKRANALKVNIGDIINVRLSTLYGQVQTASLKLIATVKLINPIMSDNTQGMLPFERLKKIAGYRPNEAQSLNIILKNLEESRDMAPFADRVHRVFKPTPVYIEGNFNAKMTRSNGILIGIQSDKTSIEEYNRKIDLLDGEIDLFEKGKGKIHISKSLAEILDVTPGSSIKLSYRLKFDEKEIVPDFIVAGIIKDPDFGISTVAFIDDESFFKAYFNDLPANNIGIKSGRLFNPESPLVTCLAHSWKLAKRTYSANDYNKKQREIRKSSYTGSILDVVTMLEPMEGVFQMEPYQESMLVVIMLIVLSIILVGVVNTTRMNIRERIREIGTVRAIGMQRKTAVRILVMEVEILCVLAILPGILSAWGLMELISNISIQTNDFYLSTILNNGHLAFKTPIGLIVPNILLINLMTFLAVYFPAKKAVNKPVADTLGHYE